MRKSLRSTVLISAALLSTAGCEWFERVFRTDQRVSLTGCLSATGGVGQAQLAWVPSVTPWLADIPNLGPTLDAQLTAIAFHAADQFGVRPAIRYYNDGASPNAFATSVLTEGAPDGTMRVGVNLVAREARRFLSTDYGVTRYYTYSITAVIAHELGHVYQFSRSAARPGKHTELQADFLAGWYFSYLSANDPNFQLNNGLGDGVRAFYELGDYQFNHPGHHGTPHERMEAFLAGYYAGANGVSQAWNAAVAYRSQIGG